MSTEERVSGDGEVNTEEQGRAGARAGAPALSGTRGAFSSSGAHRASGSYAPLSPCNPLSPRNPLNTHNPHKPHNPLNAHNPHNLHNPLSAHDPFAPPGTSLGPTPGHGRHPGHHPATTPGKLLAGVAWAVLLLGLWLWGRDLADGVAAQLATTGDVAAVGRPLGRQAPPHAHAPLTAAVRAEPVGLTIDALGVREGGIVARGLDAYGILTPPPDTSPALAGWYADGPQPGEAGAALLVGRGGSGRDPQARQALVHRLTALGPGDRVDIQRSDGSTARFTVEDVQLYDRDRFDARRAYAARDRGRSELRLIVDSGDSEGDGDSGGDGGHGQAAPRARGNGAPNVVVVSAYLTSLQAAATRGG
ncbi:sortase domain-bontaining protein [Streptomyces lydicus]|uniref:sortase domain-containing protein n=1 Tax=Streptomyces lydicus TaxID=47763 RepID=UPI0036A194E7